MDSYWYYVYLTMKDGSISFGKGLCNSGCDEFDFVQFDSKYPNSVPISITEISREQYIALLEL